MVCTIKKGMHPERCPEEGRYPVMPPLPYVAVSSAALFARTLATTTQTPLLAAMNLYSNLPGQIPAAGHSAAHPRRYTSAAINRASFSRQYPTTSASSHYSFLSLATYGYTLSGSALPWSRLMLGLVIQAPPLHRKPVPYSTTAERYPTYSGGTVRAARPSKKQRRTGTVKG